MSHHDEPAKALAARRLTVLDLPSLGEDDRPAPIAQRCIRAQRFRNGASSRYDDLTPLLARSA